MARQGAPVLFEDIFEVISRDPDGKKFDKVSRFVCRSDLYEMDLQIDINVDIYPLHPTDKFSLALAWTLNTDGTPMSDRYDAAFHQSSGRGSLMDSYDYVMHGKVFKYKDSGADAGGHSKVEVFVSFGGLLMQLVGDPKKLQSLEVDGDVFLLIRKLG